MKIRTSVFTMITIGCCISAAFAAPQKVNFQGKLTDAVGNPINASVSMVFTILRSCDLHRSSQYALD